MKKIIGALVAAIAAAIGVLFTPVVVMWCLIVLGLGVVGTMTGWGSTEMHKRLFIVPPITLTRYGKPIPQRDYWHTEKGKRCIRAWAFVYGFCWTFVTGVVCWLLITPGSLNSKQIFAVVVLWTVWSVLVGVSSPATYRFSKRYLLPLVVKRIDPAMAPDEETGDDATIVPDEIRRKHHVVED